MTHDCGHNDAPRGVQCGLNGCYYGAEIILK